MVTTEDIDNLEEYLNNFSTDYKLVYDSLRKLKGEDVSSALLQKSEDYIKNVDVRLERMKTVYNGFIGNYRKICDSYETSIKSIEEEEKNEIEGYFKNREDRLKRMKLAYDGFLSEFEKHHKCYVNDMNNIEEENRNECGQLKTDINNLSMNLKKKIEVMEIKGIEERSELSFIYKDGSKSKLNAELVLQHSDSYFYKEYMSDKRTSKGDVFIDCDGENDELIVKYMNNDMSLIDDLKKMNNEKKSKLLANLSFFELPIKKDVIKQICRNEDNEMMEAWKERVVRVNGKNANDFNIQLKRYNLLDSLFNNEYLKNIQYDKQNDVFCIDIKMKYLNVIEDYLKNGKKINVGLVKRYDGNGNSDELMNEMKMIGIELNEREKKEISGCFDPRFLRGSIIVLDKKYDSYLKRWLGNDYKWKLLYRASEHDYTASSFHEYCDNKGPTLVVIKSSGGWIFGGYTTQSWSGSGVNVLSLRIFDNGCVADDKAFIFTLKNPHGVPSTRYIKKRNCINSIKCDPRFGPTFTNIPIFKFDIFIGDNCNRNNSCYIDNDGTNGYECDPQYKESLFVNTAGPNERNKFSVLDYEVFGIDYESKYTIDNLCKYPNIIWEYIETRDISEESLKQIDERELLNDLEVIHCEDNNIRLKISKYYLKNASKLLVNTQLVNEQYDGKLREWLGNDYKWKLLYRASEHDYTAKSFHEYCDNKGPTLVVIKSSGGWIFGGYTTKSWKVVHHNELDCIYYDMIY